ncbi:MAG: hypothetical protein ACPGTU_14105, partial [Myxococcota bacterium]
MADLNRRDFLKVLGISGTASACSIDPVTPIEKVLPYVVTPDQIVPGVATWFATQCTACPAGCGVLAKNREGRIIMLEGNPEHPTNKGSLCAKGTVDLQATYSPDRFSGPAIAGQPSTWDDAIGAVAGAVKAAQASGKQVAWIGRERTGATAAVTDDTMGALQASVVRWEPLGKEALRAATKTVFGIDGIPTYLLDQAHTVISLGADFLSTWGDPSHARGFADGRDPDMCGFISKFYAIEPRLSNTSVNADIHLAAAPGTEAGVALAIARLLADKKNYTGPAKALLAGVDVDANISSAGVSMERITALVEELAYNTSIVMPGGTTTIDEEATAIASLILNEVAGNIGISLTFGQVQNLAGIGSYADVNAVLENADKIGVLFIDELDLVFATPGSAASEALAKVGQVVAFTNEPNESLTQNAIVLPPGTTLENWGDNESVLGRYTLQQPGMKSLHDTMSTGDVLLALRKALGGGTEEEPLAADFRTYLQDWWKENIFPQSDSEDWASFWRSSVQTGGFFTEVEDVKPTFNAQTALPNAGAASGEVTLSLFPHHILYDGRHANRPWAHEMPEPVSGNVWGTWAEVSLSTAKNLGL